GTTAVQRTQPSAVVAPSGHRTVELGPATIAARSSLAEPRTDARTRRPRLGDARGSAPRIAQPLRGGAPAKPGDPGSSARAAGLSGATRSLASRTGRTARGVTVMKESGRRLLSFRKKSSVRRGLVSSQSAAVAGFKENSDFSIITLDMART